MRNPLFQQTVNRDHSGRYPATSAPISYCPRCGRWFSGLALAVGLATAAFTGAGLAHADADTDPGRPAATASADTQGATSTASKDQAADTKTAITFCESVHDYVSREILEDILEDTEEHIDYLETQLELIEKVAENRAQIETIPRYNPHPRPA